MNTSLQSKNDKDQINCGRGFSLSSLLETVIDVVTGGFSSIVNNVMGGESKSTRTMYNKINYKDYQLLRVHPVTQIQVDELREMCDSEADDIRFWKQPFGNRYLI